MRTIGCVFLGAGLVTAVLATRGDEGFQSGPAQVVLVELFTSEGCSSCPPAEKWFSGLEKSAGLWTSFVPVAFHVDYWDRLGWRDRLATREATVRQYDYGKHWGSRSVYTPCFVRNGVEWHPSEQDPVEKMRLDAGVLSVKRGGGRTWRVEYQGSGAKAPALDVTVALLGNGIASAVRAGENEGRVLRHDFSVLALVQVAMMATENACYVADIELPAGSGTGCERKAIAAWVLVHGTVQPLQATGGWLVE